MDWSIFTGDWGFHIRNLEKSHEYKIWSETTRNSLMKCWKEKHAMHKLSASCQLHRNVFFLHPLLFICWGVRICWIFPLIHFELVSITPQKPSTIISGYFWIISLGKLNPQISMGSGWAPSGAQTLVSLLSVSPQGDIGLGSEAIAILAKIDQKSSYRAFPKLVVSQNWRFPQNWGFPPKLELSQNWGFPQNWRFPKIGGFPEWWV